MRMPPLMGHTGSQKAWPPKLPGSVVAIDVTGALSGSGQAWTVLSELLS